MGLKEQIAHFDRIDWTKVTMLLETYSLVKIFIGIVTRADDDLKWYSNLETRAKIEWKYQLSPSTVKAGIARLKQSGVLISNSRGIYTVSNDFLL